MLKIKQYLHQSLHLRHRTSWPLVAPSARIDKTPRDLYTISKNTRCHCQVQNHNVVPHFPRAPGTEEY